MNKQLNLFTDEQLKEIEVPTKKLKRDKIEKATINGNGPSTFKIPEYQTLRIDLNEWEVVSEEVDDLNVMEIKLKRRK